MLSLRIGDYKIGRTISENKDVIGRNIEATVDGKKLSYYQGMDNRGNTTEGFNFNGNGVYASKMMGCNSVGLDNNRYRAVGTQNIFGMKIVSILDKNTGNFSIGTINSNGEMSVGQSNIYGM